MDPLHHRHSTRHLFTKDTHHIATDGKGHEKANDYTRPVEVLIKVEFAAFITFVMYIADIGCYIYDFPHVLGHDAAGTVVQIGDCVEICA